MAININKKKKSFADMFASIQRIAQTGAKSQPQPRGEKNRDTRNGVVVSAAGRVSRGVSSVRNKAGIGEASTGPSIRLKYGSGKWYAGSAPTQSETIARMYLVAGDDRNKQRELEDLYNEEIKNAGSPIYNPYSEPTNWQAINGLRELGFDFGSEPSHEWLEQNKGLLQGARYTNTGLTPAAPTKPSTPEEDAAYWLDTLYDVEERTIAAETEFKALADEIKYYAERGYSDNEILKAVKADFGSKYATLQDMDDERLRGRALALNRAINYSGDDTLTGMIWAARNGDESGDYLIAAVNSQLGRGKKYKPDPGSEAARDPANTESYNPYYGGSNMHEVNMRTGATSYDNEWLVENRNVYLNGTEQQKQDWQAIADAVENTDQATAELSALNEWLGDQVSKDRLTADDIINEFRALLEEPEYSTLAKMERQRLRGGYLDLAYEVNFTAPQFEQAIRDAVAERDAVTEAANAEKQAAAEAKKQERIDKVKAAIAGGSAFMNGGVKQETTEPVEEEEAPVEPAKPGYEKSAAYKGLFGSAVEEQPREGMTNGGFVPQRYAEEAILRPGSDHGKQTAIGSPEPAQMTPLGDLNKGKADPNSEDGQAFIAMLEGGEWDGSVYAWAEANTADRAGMEDELIQGIKDIRRGISPDEVSGLARSWWNAHTHLAAYLSRDLSGSSFIGGTSEQWDARAQYGDEIYSAIMANEEAEDNGAISAEQYIENLIEIGDVTDMIDGIAEQTGMSKTEALQEIYVTVPGQEAKIARVVTACEDALAADAADREAMEQEYLRMSREAFEAYAAGTADEGQQMFMQAAMAMDVTDVAREDAGYQLIDSQIRDSLTLDSLRQRGINAETFVPGAYSPEAMVDPEAIFNTGAMAYTQGVQDIAEAKLETDMHFAAVCSMSLDEFYEAYPERARTAEQILTEAENEYVSAWRDEFGGTLQGLLDMNSTEDAEGAEDRIAPEDSLTFRETAGLATQAASESFMLSLYKTWDFLVHQGMNGSQAEARVRRTYGNDPAAYRSDLTAYRDSLPEGDPQRKEITTLLETDEGDLFTYGKTIPQMKSSANVQGAQANIQAIQKTVEKYGTKGDKTVFDAVSSIESSIALLGTSALGTAAGLPGLAASILAAAPEGFSTGYDLEQQGVQHGAAIAASLGIATASGALENKMNVEYLPSSFGAKQSTLAQWAKDQLAQKGFVQMVKKNPRAATRLITAALYSAAGATASAAGEATQELAQSVANNIIYNGTMNLSGLREGFVLSPDDLREAVEAGAMGFITSFPLSGAGAIAEAMTSPLSTPTTDLKGDIISMAEAQLQPEHEGTLINEAVNNKITEEAMREAAAELEAVASSPEQAAAEQVHTDLDAALKDLNDAETEYNQVDAEVSAMQAELLEADAEMQQGEEFDAEMQKRMTSLADKIVEASSRLTDAIAKVKEKRAAAEAAQTAAEEADAAVQGLYDDIMERARQGVRQRVIDTLFEGVDEDARTAEEFYLEKCAELTAAKEELRSAKADLDIYRAGSARSDEARREYGRKLAEVERLEDEVVRAKAAADEAYAKTPEAVGEAAMKTAELASETAAQEAEAAAAAEPENAQAQAFAGVQRAKAVAEAAGRKLNEVRKQVTEQLRSASREVRAKAVETFETATQEAQDAQAAAETAQAEYDAEYSAQGRLQKAIDNFRQYDDEDLLFEDSENHEAAVKAYDELAVAALTAEMENARATMEEARTLIESENPSTIRAYKEKRAAYEDAANAVMNAYPSSGIGFRPFSSYSPEKQQVIVEYLGAVDGEMVKYYEAANEENPQWARPYQMGRFENEEVAASVESALGFSVNGWNVSINDGACRHIMKRHGLNGEADSSMQNPNDVARAKYVITNSDLAFVVDDTTNAYKNSDGTPAKKIQFEKAINGTYYVVAAAPDTKKRTLNIITVYANKKEASAVPASGVTGRQANVHDERQSTSADIIADRMDNVKYARSGGWADHGSAAKTGETTVADRNPIEILSDLTRSIRVGYSPSGPMNAGRRRLPLEVMGFYNSISKGIRVRSQYAGDLAIGLHEFGHAVQDRLPSLHATNAMIDALPQFVKDSYTARELDGEAVAEFVVAYMYSRDQAVAMAGDTFVRDFERMLHTDDELNAAVSRARDQIVLWNNSDPASRVDAMVKDATEAQKRDKASADAWYKRIRTMVFDSNNPLRKLGQNVYTMARWSKWAANRADVLMEKNLIDMDGNIVGKSVTQQLADIGWKPEMEDDAVRYMIARNALSRLSQGKPAFAEDEISRDDLERIVRDVEANNPVAAEAADVFVNFWRFMTDNWLVPSGLMTQETRDKLWQMYPYYVPLNRVTDVNWSKKDIESGTFRIRGVKKNGSSLEIINPIQSLIAKTQSAVRSVARNQLMQTIDEVAQQGGIEDIVKEITADMAVTKVDTSELEAAMRAAFDSADNISPDAVANAFELLTDMEEQWRSLERSLKPNVIAGRRADGTMFFYQIQKGNEDLYKALTHSPNTTEGLLRAWKKINNTFTQVVTQKNPQFALSNAISDFWTSVNTGSWASNYLTGAAKWLAGLYDVATNAKGFQEFEAAGGGSHNKYSINTDKGLRQIRRDVLGNKDALPVRAAKSAFNFITAASLNDAVEITSRYVEYKYGKHDKSTAEGRREAVAASQDVTVDFSMSGMSDTVREALQCIPFGNATAQGLNKTLTMLQNLGSSDAKIRSRAVTGLTKTVVNTGITAAVQAYVLGALFGGEDDEETREAYARLNDEVKAGNLILPLDRDVTDAAGYDRPYLRIPLTKDALSRAVYAFALDMFSNVADMDELSLDLMDVAKSLLTDSLPGQTINASIGDALNNRTWYGGQIVSDYMLDTRTPTNQTKDGTPEVFNALANAATNTVRLFNPDFEGFSPAILAYIFEQNTGYFGKVIMPLVSKGRYTDEWTVRGALENLGYTMGKRFTIDPNVSNNLSKDFNNAYDMLEKIVSEAKSGLPISRLGFSLTDSQRREAVKEAERLLKGVMARTKKEVNALWDEIDAISQSQRLTDAEKAIQIMEIKAEQARAYEAAQPDLGEYIQDYIECDPIITQVTNILNERPTLN